MWATMPTIKVNRIIYVPKLLPPLTLESLKRAYTNSSNQIIDPEDDLSQWKSDIHSSPNLVLISEEIDSKEIEPEESENFKSYGNKSAIYERKLHGRGENVGIRILSNRKLPKIRRISMKNKGEKGRKMVEESADTIIIHYHGGGFVAMSSKSHQHYTRDWAKRTGFIVFSVDYRKAPHTKYPHILDDAWQAYVWIVTQSKVQLGIQPTHIILAGDSAGGNLCLSVTLRAIHTRFTKPDGLCLAYPGIYIYIYIYSIYYILYTLATNLNMQDFTPSLLYGLDDVLLRYCFLNICMEAYVGEGDVRQDPYLSPLIMNEHVNKYVI